jgi:hypothetical protein
MTAALIALLLCGPGRAVADDIGDAKNIINQAEATLKNFMTLT